MLNQNQLAQSRRYMPVIKSAKKRVKVAAKANLRNARTKRTMREAIKAFHKALTSGKSSDITDTERKAVSAIDKAAKKAVIHKNKAARQKAQISAKAKSAGAKPAKKTALKPAASKKSPAKNPAAKSKKTSK